jgi:hypothetical protein
VHESFTCASVSACANPGIERPGSPAGGAMPSSVMRTRFAEVGSLGALAAASSSALPEEASRPRSWQVPHAPA